MIPISLQMTGLATSRGKLLLFPPLIKRGATEGLREVGYFMETEVKNSIAGRKAEPTSVDTGRFLNSITSSQKGLEVSIQDGVDYGKHLEYGTRRLGARRHFGNSLSRNKSRIVNYLQKKINTII